jgi:hypothetical protein
MVRRLLSLVKELFSHEHARKEGDVKARQAASEQQDKLDKQRADWEGMTPN